MIYLSDPIYIERNFKNEGSIGSSLPYRISIRHSGVSPYSKSNYSYTQIYVGHIYVSGEDQKIYLNDIIESQLSNHSCFIPNLSLTPSTYTSDVSVRGVTKTNYDDSYKIVDVKFQCGGYTEEIPVIVQYQKDVNIERGQLINPNTTTPIIYNLLNQRTNIIPRIPRLSFVTNKFWVGATVSMSKGFWIESQSEGDPIYGWIGLTTPPTSSYTGINQSTNYLLFDAKGTTFTQNITGEGLKTLTSGYYDSKRIGVCGMRYDSSENLQFFTYTDIATIEDCPSKYYLIWMDRTGAYQCQPFSKKSSFNENISNSNLMNNIDEVRPYQKSIENQWTINSDWLTYDEYKAYESIFTSPYLYLYDTELDEGYWVNTSDINWIEKSKENTKKPFNLQLTLKSNKIQNIIY